MKMYTALVDQEIFLELTSKVSNHDSVVNQSQCLQVSREEHVANGCEHVLLRLHRSYA